MGTIRFNRLDHVLLSIAEGCTAQARTFYAEVLGLSEIPGAHPGGAIWFQLADMQLHLREEAVDNWSSRRHPAFEVTDLTAARETLERHGVAIEYSSGIDGRDRFFFRDPFGNRIELLQYSASGWSVA